MSKKERFKNYDKDYAREVFGMNGLRTSESNFLSAIMINPSVVLDKGTPKLTNIPTKSNKLFFIEHGETGRFTTPGISPVIFIREDELVDYTLISKLSGTPDADVYLALTKPYEDPGSDFERLNEWYRDETFVNHFKEEDK